MDSCLFFSSDTPYRERRKYQPVLPDRGDYGREEPQLPVPGPGSELQPYTVKPVDETTYPDSQTDQHTSQAAMDEDSGQAQIG